MRRWGAYSIDGLLADVGNKANYGTCTDKSHACTPCTCVVDDIPNEKPCAFSVMNLPTGATCGNGCADVGTIAINEAGSHCGNGNNAAAMCPGGLLPEAAYCGASPNCCDTSKHLQCLDNTCVDPAQ